MQTIFPIAIGSNRSFLSSSSEDCEKEASLVGFIAPVNPVKKAIVNAIHNNAINSIENSEKEYVKKNYTPQTLNV